MTPSPRPDHDRLELEPASPPADAALPERPAQRRADDPDVADTLDRLIEQVGGTRGSFEARLIREMLVAGLKLIPDGRDTGELKLVAAAVKELRYALRIFGQYRDPHKVTIFGSARTTPDHPDFAAAVEFSRLMARRGWMVITGAGDGIMRAGHLGPGREASFGVAIRLPFETTANEVIAGDEKLIHFRYFFTRKLMFISQAEAVALFPGGFGTLDESYEVLTLVQTGKASMIPIVCIEGAGGTYWRDWDRFTRENLLARGLISPEDVNLYYIASGPSDAANHIERFYRVYHSSRYVRDDYVIRVKRPLAPADLERINDEFAGLVRTGRIVQRGPYDAEDDHRELPRIAFTHTRRQFGLIRRLIDRINDTAPAEQ